MCAISRFCFCACLNQFSISFQLCNIVQNLKRITSEYEARLAACPYVPTCSYGRRMLREDGDPNRLFLAYLFCDDSNAIQYLKDRGLLRSTMKCNSCGRDMTWSADPTVNYKFRWRCHKNVAGKRCYTSTSIRLGSWFQQGNLTLQEIMLRHRTSFAAINSPRSEKNTPMVRTPSQTGGCSARKPCRFFWRGAPSR